MGRDKKDRIRVSAEVMTQDVIRANSVAEVARDVFWGTAINEIGPEGLVDALFGTTRLKEESPAFA